MDSEFDLDALVDQYLGVQHHNQDRGPVGPTTKNQPLPQPESPSFAGNAAKLFQRTMNAITSSKPEPDVHEYRSPSEASRPSSFYKRNPALRRIELWAERKKERRLQTELEVHSKALEECTFEPRVSDRHQSELIAPHPLYKDNKAWGYDEFVDRLVAARAQREDRRAEIEAKLGGCGDRWKPELTTPEPFEFAKFSRKKIAALQKSYDLIAPIVRDDHIGTVSAIEGPSVPSGLFSVQASSVILDHSPKRNW